MFKKIATASMILFFFFTLSNLVVFAEGASYLNFDPPNLTVYAGTTTGAVTTSFLVSTDDALYNNLKVVAEPLTDSEGKVVVPIETITLTPSRIQRLENNTPVTIGVRIDSLPNPGIYTGKIRFVFDELPEGMESTLPLTLVVTETDLTIAQKPAGPHEDISVAIEGDATSVIVPLYLRHSSQNEIKDARFFGFLNDENGEQITEATFSFSLFGQPIQETGIVIPGKGQQSLLLMTIGGLQRTGTFRGDLVIEINGVVERASAIIVTRFPHPSLKIVGTDDAGNITLNWPDKNFDHSFTIESTNLAKVDDLRIEVDPFTNAKSKPVTPSWAVEGFSNSELSVSELGAIKLRLTADLPLEETYISAIHLIYAGMRQSVSLTVIHQPASQISVKVTGLNDNLTGVLESNCWPSIMKLFRANNNHCPWSVENGVKFKVDLEETSGQDITLNLPQVVGLTRVSDKLNSLARYDRIVIMNEQGSEETSPILLPARQTKTIFVSIAGLHEAGNYDGTLRLSGPNASSLEQTFKLKAQEPMWIAIILISISVIASFFARNFIQSWRPRLDRMQTGYKLLIALEDFLKTSVPESNRWKEDLSRILTNWKVRIESTLLQEDLGTNTNVENLMKEIDEKLSLFPSLVARFEQIAKVVPNSLADTLYVDLLKPACAQLLEETTSSVAEAKNLLSIMPEKITEKRTAELQRQLMIFHQNVETERQNAEQQRQQSYQDILDRLALVEKLAARVALAEQELQTIQITIDEQSIIYIRLISQDLIKRLDQIPLGATAEEWNQAKTRFEKNLNEIISKSDSAMAVEMSELYQTTFKSYLESLVKYLGNEIEKSVQRVSDEISAKARAKTGIEEDIKTGKRESQSELDRVTQQLNELFSLKTELLNVQTQRTSILDVLQKNDTKQAQKSYNEALSTYKELKNKLILQGILGRSTVEPSYATEVAGGVVHTPINIPPVEKIAERRTLLGYRRRIVKFQLRAMDIIVNLIIFIVAVNLGVSLFYDASWGGLEDHTAVVLWGFGVQQGGQTVFTGIENFIATYFAGKGNTAG